MIEKEWEIGKPLIILSIFGDFTHDPSASSHAQQLLSDFLQSSNYVQDDDMMCWPWIVTNPLENVGREVGCIVKAINEECNMVEEKTCNMPVHCIGMCTWGMVDNSDQIKKCGTNQFTVRKPTDVGETGLLTLNPNMSHYLFVDDGTRGVRGVDRYTQKFLESYKEPRVCVFLGGGDRTLANLNKCLSDGVPCVIVTGSGGIIDKFANILTLAASSSKDQDIHDLLKMENIEKKHRNLLKECFKFRDNCHCWIKGASDFRGIQSFVLRVVGRELNFKKNETVSEESRQSAMYYVKLCQLWGRPEMANEVLSSLNTIDILRILRDAVKHGQDGMVRVLLINHFHKLAGMTLLDCREVLNHCSETLSRMKRFSELEESGRLHMVSESLKGFLHRSQSAPDEPEAYFLIKPRVDEEVIGKTQNSQSRDIESNDTQIGEDAALLDNSNQWNDCLAFLFVWSLFKYDFQMAQVIVRFLEYPMFMKLLASNILSSLRHLPGFEVHKDDLKKHADIFENQACILLKECFQTDKWKTSFILLHDHGIGVSCLELTAGNDYSHNFLVMPPCQELLTNIWTRGMNYSEKRVQLLGCRWQSVCCIAMACTALPICIGLPVSVSLQSYTIVLGCAGLSAFLSILMAAIFQNCDMFQKYLYHPRSDKELQNCLRVREQPFQPNPIPS